MISAAILTTVILILNTLNLLGLLIAHNISWSSICGTHNFLVPSETHHEESKKDKMTVYFLVDCRIHRNIFESFKFQVVIKFKDIAKKYIF